MPLAVKVFSTDIRTAAVSGLSIVARAQLVAREIQAGYDQGCRVFLGPEYLFAHHIASLPGNCSPISYDEADQARSIIARASERARDMLVVPGTFFFVNGVSNPKVFNTAFAYLNGTKLAEVSKTGHALDGQYASNSGHTYMPMADPDAGVVFSWAGRQVCLQICTDITINPPAACALGLHPAFMPGAVMAHTIGHSNAPQQRVIVDGAGAVRAMPSQTTTIAQGIVRFP